MLPGRCGIVEGEPPSLPVWEGSAPGGRARAYGLCTARLSPHRPADDSVLMPTHLLLCPVASSDRARLSEASRSGQIDSLGAPNYSDVSSGQLRDLKEGTDDKYARGEDFDLQYTAAILFFKLVLSVYPREFISDFGEEIENDFREGYSERKGLQRLRWLYWQNMSTLMSAMQNRMTTTRTSDNLTERRSKVGRRRSIIDS